MEDAALTQALSRALLALRITLGLFLLQWGVEKLVVPQNTVAIWGYFYGLDVPRALGYLFGAAEIAIAGCLFLGLFRTVAYGAALALHMISVLVSWRQLLDPWGDPANHLFIAGIPVLGALIALFLLRHWDRGIVMADHSSAAPGSPPTS
ncbi:DoxX family protein [Virgifigura deserti]|uniref:DoxX family protein n=1 Tax=Virgifigura deserti TaxID=2268457 RepID=UPI003CCBCAC8